MFTANRVRFFAIGFLLASFGGIFYAPVQAGWVQKVAEAAKANAAAQAAAQANAKVAVKPAKEIVVVAVKPGNQARSTGKGEVETDAMREQRALDNKAMVQGWIKEHREKQARIKELCLLLREQLNGHGGLNVSLNNFQRDAIAYYQNAIDGQNEYLASFE